MGTQHRGLFIKVSESGEREYLCHICSYKSITRALVDAGVNYTLEEADMGITITISSNDCARFWDVMGIDRATGTMFL